LQNKGLQIFVANQLELKLHSDRTVAAPLHGEESPDQKRHGRKNCMLVEDLIEFWLLNAGERTAMASACCVRGRCVRVDHAICSVGSQSRSVRDGLKGTSLFLAGLPE
jgi:hypothetical protein